MCPNCRLHLGEDDPVGCDDDVILRHLSLCDFPLLVPVVHQHAQPTRLHLRRIVYKLGENFYVDFKIHDPLNMVSSITIKN